MSTSLRLLTIALSLLVPGCPTSSDPGSDTPLIDAATADVPASEDSGVPPIDAPSTADTPVLDAAVTDAGGSCGYVDTVDRSCTTDEDCLVRLHQTDCCGNSVMIGIAMGALGVYNANEPACMASYPACECPAGLPTTDSGETVTDTAAVRAACVSRGPRDVCVTYVTMRPADGR